MLGCENMVSAAAASDNHSTASAPIIVASGEACASMHSHDCCAKRGAKSASKSAHKPAETLTGDIAPATHAAEDARLGHAAYQVLGLIAPFLVGDARALVERLGADYVQ